MTARAIRQPLSLVLLTATMLVARPALPLTPPTSPAMQEANAFYQARKWAEAREAYEAIVKTESENPQVWYRLGVSRQGLEDFEGAIEAYRKCIGLNPTQSFAMYNAACASARLGFKSEAVDWLQQSVAAGFPGGRGISADPDLASLKGDAGYEELLKVVAAKVTPCLVAPEYSQFDFWVGEWDVESQGQPVGTSSIQKVADGCLILENWTDRAGGSGKSLNYFDPATGKWYQKWVGSGGDILEVAGVYKDRALRYEGEKISREGRKSLERLTFFDMGPDQVRQFREQSTDDGKSWRVLYDFMYLRRKA